MPGSKIATTRREGMGKLGREIEQTHDLPEAVRNVLRACTGDLVLVELL